MQLPSRVLELMKAAALSGGMALASAGCVEADEPPTTPTGVPIVQISGGEGGGTWVWEGPQQAPVAYPVMVQQPCPYRPVVTVQPTPLPPPAAPPEPPDDPCLGCGMG